MNPRAEDSVPTPAGVWEEIRRVKALLERRVAEQMAATWRRAGLNAAGAPRSTGARVERNSALDGNGGGHPA